MVCGLIPHSLIHGHICSGRIVHMLIQLQGNLFQYEHIFALFGIMHKRQMLLVGHFTVEPLLGPYHFASHCIVTSLFTS